MIIPESAFAQANPSPAVAGASRRKAYFGGMNIRRATARITWAMPAIFGITVAAWVWRERVLRRLYSSRGAHASLKRTTGRCGFRRATCEKPALSYIDFAPNHMKSSFERAGLSTG